MVMKDYLPHRTDEIVLRVYGNEKLGLARVGARIWDMQKKYKVKVLGWHDEDNVALYWYRVIPPAPVPEPLKAMEMPLPQVFSAAFIERKKQEAATLI